MGVAIPTTWVTAITGISPRHAQLLSYIVTPLVILALLPVLQIGLPGNHCLFRACLGVVCPGCGVTRSVVAALHGDFRAAWEFNPCGLLVLMALVGQAVFAGLEWIFERHRTISLKHALFSNFIVMTTLLVVWLIRILVLLTSH